MHGIEGGKIEQFPCDAGLVAGDAHQKTGLFQAGDGFQAAFDGLPFIGILDELIGVGIDDAVAVRMMC